MVKMVNFLLHVFFLTTIKKKLNTAVGHQIAILLLDSASLRLDV